MPEWRKFRPVDSKLTVRGDKTMPQLSRFACLRYWQRFQLPPPRLYAVIFVQKGWGPYYIGHTNGQGETYICATPIETDYVALPLDYEDLTVFAVETLDDTVDGLTYPLELDSWGWVPQKTQHPVTILSRR